jgi:hypothetical protein
MSEDEIEYSIYDQLVEQIKSIDTDDLSDDVSQTPTMSEVEKQMVYIWIRLYLKEEISNIKDGDEFVIKYKLSGEELNTTFICFGKQNSFKDSEDYTEIQMLSEDDKKVLCLMVNEEDIKIGESIPFIRTLFKGSVHYQEQVYHRDDMTFTNKRTSEVMNYIDCDF